MTESYQPARFRDMGLQVGQSVQLNVDRTGGQKFYTTVIGWVEGDFLMLRVPGENGSSLHLRVGEVVEVKLFSGVSVFTFNTRIDTLLHHPRDYMLTSFPEKVLGARLRAHLRVATKLPVQILEVNGELFNHEGCRLEDLSGGGAAILSPVALGKEGDELLLSMHFNLESTQSTEHVLLKANVLSAQQHVMNNTSSASPWHKHAVKFQQVDPRVVLLVNELQA